MCLDPNELVHKVLGLPPSVNVSWEGERCAWAISLGETIWLLWVTELLRSSYCSFWKWACGDPSTGIEGGETNYWQINVKLITSHNGYMLFPGAKAMCQWTSFAGEREPESSVAFLSCLWLVPVDKKMLDHDRPLAWTSRALLTFLPCLHLHTVCGPWTYGSLGTSRLEGQCLKTVGDSC